tara:strand:- start:117 stop:683 length:567 start_codon:yes stop_codon:yes gene_type:complete
MHNLFAPFFVTASTTEVSFGVKVSGEGDDTVHRILTFSARDGAARAGGKTEWIFRAAMDTADAWRSALEESGWTCVGLDQPTVVAVVAEIKSDATRTTALLATSSPADVERTSVAMGATHSAAAAAPVAAAPAAPSAQPSAIRTYLDDCAAALCDLDALTMEDIMEHHEAQMTIDGGDTQKGGADDAD